jgi:glycosyltransferase involved in cell wall biosynthesis
MTVAGLRLCFVGQMVGRNRGYVTSQGERLSDLFAGLGYPVTTVSALRNRYARVADIALTLLSRRLDVVVLQVFSGPSFAISDLASRIASLRGVPLVMILRGGNLPVFMARHPRWARAVLGRAGVLVAPSRYLARAIEEHGFQCELIPNLIELGAYAYRHRDRVGPALFWMRSFHPIYNPELAVRVLARVRRELPDATLVMAGPDKGTMRRTQQLAVELGVADAIRFA